MSTTALTNLRDYLTGTLSPDDMMWLATQLTEYTKKEDHSLKPYTKEEINSMLDEAEANIAAGNVIDDEEVWRELEEEFAREDAEEDTRRVYFVEESQLEAV